MADMHYHDYLQLDKILNAQTLESDKKNLSAHDEMLFIVIHQPLHPGMRESHAAPPDANGLMHDTDVT